MSDSDDDFAPKKNPWDEENPVRQSGPAQGSANTTARQFAQRPRRGPLGWTARPNTPSPRGRDEAAAAENPQGRRD